MSVPAGDVVTLESRPAGDDPLLRAIEIADSLIASGRERDALTLLRERILPALDERARLAAAAARNATGHGLRGPW